MSGSTLLRNFGLGLRKGAPFILFGLGTGAEIYGTYLATKNIAKVQERIKYYKEEELPNLDHYAHDKGDSTWARMRISDENDEGVIYSEEQYKLDQKSLKISCILDSAKAMAPGILIGLAGIGLATTGICILNTRLVRTEKKLIAVEGALAAVNTAFVTYRKRVIDREGKMRDLEYMYGDDIQEEEVKVTDERGKTKTVKKEKVTLQPSMFARFFDNSCNEWSDDQELNLTVLHSLQRQFQRTLDTVGVVHLNDVYRALGMNPSELGSRAGWIRNTSMIEEEDQTIHYELTDEPIIDFGIFRSDDIPTRSYVNLTGEDVILLDFNCNCMNVYKYMDL